MCVITLHVPCSATTEYVQNYIPYKHGLFQVEVKVMQSHNRPGVAQRFPGGLVSQISRHSAHEGGEVVSLTHRPPLHPGNVPGIHFH